MFDFSQCLYERRMFHALHFQYCLYIILKIASFHQNLLLFESKSEWIFKACMQITIKKKLYWKTLSYKQKNNNSSSSTDQQHHQDNFLFSDTQKLKREKKKTQKTTATLKLWSKRYAYNTLTTIPIWTIVGEWTSERVSEQRDGDV